MRPRWITLAALATLIGWTGPLRAFDGTGDWPESGEVLIEGTVVVDEPHLSAFAGWSSIVFADSSATLRLVNSATPVTLTAPVRGSGTFEVKDSAGLTLAADNSGLTGNGRFFITNSVVNLAHEYGLGSTKPCRFYWGENGALSFTTTDGVLTNKVPITYDGVSEAGYRIYLGSQTSSETVVQNAAFLALTGGSTQGQAVLFENNFEFNRGNFGSTSSGVDVYCRALSGACVRFSGCTLTVADGCGIYLIGSSGAGGTYHLAPKSMSVSRLAVGNGVRVVCDKTDALAGAEELYFYGIANQSGCLDLNGFDQTVPSIKPQKKSSESAEEYAVVSSPSPATLTVEATADASSMLEFAGAASFRYRGSAVNTFARRVSNTTGTLYVTSGTQAFEHGAGWNGDVTVDGGTLRISAASDLPDGKARLRLSDGGRLDLRTDVTVGAFNVDGEELVPGDYSAATLAEAGYPDRMAGGGVLHVQGAARTWTGWANAQGGIAYVPAGQTVTIADADVEAVSAVSRIFCGAGSTIACGNATEPLTLSARLSGGGEFRIVDSAGVTILGDNSALISPGAFYISNSPVIVSNEFGLGSAQTAAATVYWGDRGALEFGCASGHFTNNVAIRYDGVAATDRYRIYFGSRSPEEYLVQNASFLHMSGGTEKGRYLVLTNNVLFTGGSFGSEKGALYTRYEGEGEYGVVGDASLSFRDANTTWALIGQDSVCRLAPASVERPFKQLSLNSPGIRIICERPNVLGSETPIKFYLHETNPSRLDLNGFDQTLPDLVSANAGFAAITSSAPATLTLSTKQDAACKLRFFGSAGLRFAGAGTLSFAEAVSPTAGTLEIDSGVCSFADNAGWGGTNVVVNGGTLRIAPSAAETAFAPSTRQTGVTLTVAAGGALELDDGVEVAVRTVGGAASLSGCGWYGGAEAQAKGLVDAVHTLPWISGSGLLRILNAGSSGTILILK